MIIYLYLPTKQIPILNATPVTCYLSNSNVRINVIAPESKIAKKRSVTAVLSSTLDYIRSNAQRPALPSNRACIV